MNLDALLTVGPGEPELVTGAQITFLAPTVAAEVLAGLAREGLAVRIGVIVDAP